MAGRAHHRECEAAAPRTGLNRWVISLGASVGDGGDTTDVVTVNPQRIDEIMEATARYLSIGLCQHGGQ